ncbi:MAG: tetratricopeptide (TPR) repeat protein, partial [Bradymonadia bacterium]
MRRVLRHTGDSTESDMMNALLAHERLHALLHDHGTWDAACSALGTPADGTAERALVAACRALAGNPHAGDADKVEEWVADPADADLRLAALACIYCSLRDADALTEVTLERRSAHASANNANAMLAELALALTQLAPDAEATTLVCTQAFEVAPEHPAATSAIIALSKTRADTPSRTYELLLDGLRQMTNAGRVHETAPLQRALGCWSRDELHDEILAEGHFARVFELDPDDEPTQRWLLQIWREAGDLARVGQVLATRVDQAPTDQTRARELLAHLDGVNEWQRWSDVFERWSCAHQSAAESSAIDSDLLSAEDLMLRHVSILRDHLNDSSAGESALTKARKRCPHSVSIAAASMAFGHPLDPAERAECATLVASACSEPARTIEAAEAWVKAGDPERAHTLAMSLPSLDELPCETLERVAEIAEQAHALDDATRVWVRAAECGTEDSQTAECFRRAALATQAEGGSPLPWLEAAVAAAPTRRDLVEALATEARRVEDWASARAAFAAICAMADIGADSAPPWEALAEAEMHLGHHDAAAAAWAKLIETRPEPPALQRGADALAEIATMEENWALLRALLPHHALLSGTDNATTAFALGRCFADENDTANARAWLSQVVALSPAHQGALRWLALHGEAESADAIIGLLRGTHEPGARFTLLLRLARARRSAGDWEGAVAAYELAAESDANAVEPLHHLLSLHMERQHWPLAIDVLARLSQRAPELALRLERTAGVLYLEELRDPQNAAHCFQRALRADPNDTESREALLAIHRASGDDDALAATLTDLLSARADSDAALELGDLLVGRLGRYDDAVRVWRHAAASVTDP